MSVTEKVLGRLHYQEKIRLILAEHGIELAAPSHAPSADKAGLMSVPCKDAEGKPTLQYHLLATQAEFEKIRPVLESTGLAKMLGLESPQPESIGRSDGVQSFVGRALAVNETEPDKYGDPQPSGLNRLLEEMMARELAAKARGPFSAREGERRSGGANMGAPG